MRVLQRPNQELFETRGRDLATVSIVEALRESASSLDLTNIQSPRARHEIKRTALNIFHVAYDREKLPGFNYVSSAAHAFCSCLDFCGSKKWQPVALAAHQYLLESLDFANRLTQRRSGLESMQDRSLEKKFEQFEISKRGIPRIVFEERNQFQKVAHAEIRSFKRVLEAAKQQLEKMNNPEQDRPAYYSLLNRIVLDLNEVSVRLNDGLLLNPRLSELLDQSRECLRLAKEGSSDVQILIENINSIIDSDPPLPEKENKEIGLVIAQNEFYDKDHISFEKIEELNRSLLIDKNLHTPQNGFGYVADIKTIEKWFNQIGVRLLTLSQHGQLIGYYAIFHGPYDTPEDAQHVSQKIKREGLRFENDCAWAHMVGISKESRKADLNKNIDLYKFLNEALRDALMADHFEMAFGICRDGDNANTALRRHLDPEIGWILTGRQILIDGVPFHVMVQEMY